MITTQIAQVALEWWRASGPRTEERLRALVAHHANHTAGGAKEMELHIQSAFASLKPWEKFES